MARKLSIPEEREKARLKAQILTERVRAAEARAKIDAAKQQLIRLSPAKGKK